MARIRMVKEWEINGFLFAKGSLSEALMAKPSKALDYRVESCGL